MAGLAGPVRAGWKITTQTNTASDQSVLTEYFDGEFKRTDQTDSKGGRYVTVVDFNHPRQISWNMDLQQYVVLRLTRRYEGFTLSPQTIVVDQVTTDTGERRTIFGRSARHLLTRETSHVKAVQLVSLSDRLTGGMWMPIGCLPRNAAGPFIFSQSARQGLTSK